MLLEPKLLDNDEALDLKSRFYALYDQGKTTEEVRHLINCEFRLMMDGNFSFKTKQVLG